MHCCPLLCLGNIEILGRQKLTVALGTIFSVLSESVTENVDLELPQETQYHHKTNLARLLLQPL